MTLTTRLMLPVLSAAHGAGSSQPNDPTLDPFGELLMELAQSTLCLGIDKGAKQLLLKLLARLEQGQLVLHDGSECHRFGKAGSDLHAELVVQDPAFYRRLLLGASPQERPGWRVWTSPEPVALVRLLARNLPLLDALERRLGWLSFPFNKVRHWFNRNTLTGSRAQHRRPL